MTANREPSNQSFEIDREATVCHCEPSLFFENFFRDCVRMPIARRRLEDRLGIEVTEVGYPNLDRFAFLRKHGLPAPAYGDNPSP
jgi:hypothetical protein